MNLTDEQKEQGRRNFLKALAGTPALAALGVAAATHGPIKGGPVKAAVIGTGGMGRGLIAQCQKDLIDLRALCDINPKRRRAVAETLVKNGWPQPKEYDDWREMLQKEDLEAVIIATPLWSHADIAVGCLDAGKHVLCEKMMAKSEADCLRMIDAMKRNKRLLEIGYQRYYNPVYQASYSNIIKQGLIGEVYFARLVWHRNGNWRRKEDPPAPDFNPGKWGYPDWEHLVNWRLYKQYSEGLMAELGSHLITATNWFFEAPPVAAYSTGSIARFNDGREVYDHVYATLEYPGGRAATFSSIESNAFEDHYEMFLGTKGTLILQNEVEVYLFYEGEAATTKVEVSRQSAAPVADTSATRPADAPGRTVNAATAGQVDRNISYRNEIAEFCASVRTGKPVRCGPQKAMQSALAVLTANQAAEKRARVEIKPATPSAA
ncbi:MAG: Gfo/Idh/MocA family oxidoreductase [Acidobacteria bacterium]|nr:Gfo/Idh/MocA family oxidoreductase [Acidobacteriota bacterium]MBI3426422.1 Gfo/Idh/MocA family oxidoreductase [Acidobacteriota bacterium]